MASGAVVTSEHVRERRNTLLRVAGERLQETIEHSDGFAYRFPVDILDELVQFIGLERERGPFLRFTLTVEPGNGPVCLEIIGFAESKAFLATFSE